MKLIHLTAKKFQFKTADSLYVISLAEKFNILLKQNRMRLSWLKANMMKFAGFPNRS